MALYDLEAKKRLGYKDKRSKVRFSGEEILFGTDWEKRKVELLGRSAGYCERLSILGTPHDPWCNKEGGEPHHIIPRRDGRDDRLQNLANLSHWCHAAEDYRVPRFGEGRGESAESRK